MSFNLLRNLGLAALVLLLLGVVVTDHNSRQRNSAALQEIIKVNLPAQQALLRAHLHIRAARHQFDLYDQRERINVGAVQQSLTVFKNAIGQLKINLQTEMDLALHRLIAIWNSYLDEEKIDPAGDEANQLNLLLNEHLVLLRELINSFSNGRPSGVKAEQLRSFQTLEKTLDQVEANILTYIHRRRYSISPVSAQLELALEDLKFVQPTMLSNEMNFSYGELLKSTKMTRSLVYSYLDEESIDFATDSFVMSRSNLYRGWEDLVLLVSKADTLLKQQLDLSHEKLLDETDAAQQLLNLFARIAVILAILISIVLGRALNRRLQVLELGAKHFERGELDYHIPMKIKDNIGSLADTLNSMAGQLLKQTQILEESRQAALLASQAKSEFLAKMSHEIRTPMNGVLGMTELLLTSGLTNKQHNYTKTIQRSGQMLLGIINDVLDFSKIEANRLKLELAPFDLEEMVEDVLQMLAEQARIKHLELLSDCHSGLHVKVIGDGPRLRQILINLVGNALKFTERGEIIVRVSPLVENDEEILILFEVQDSGEGIDSDKLACIFDDFIQADDSANRRHDGTGLGLAISKQLVALMGGEIGVESKKDSGSKFHFTARLGKQAVETGTPSIIHCKGSKVLVVDDNLPTRRLLVRKIEDWGLQATAADCGAEALRLLQEAATAGKPYALAILDWKMSGMDGITLAQKIKGDPTTVDTRLLMYSALNVDVKDTTWRDAGVDVYLSKPARLIELHDQLLSLLENNPSTMDSLEVLSTDAVETAETIQRDCHILLVEDNLVNQEVALGMLEMFGYRTEVADNGLAAVEYMKAHSCDLILMDCHMPEMDGFAATKSIRNQESEGDHVPVIALTADVQKGMREKCLTAGMNDHLGKPFSPEALQAMLKKWLSARDKKSA